jgi:error-prone DNA polymerase
MASPDLLPAYAELHCLSNFSFLRGASHPEELVERAKSQGYAALALTDECSLAGAVRAHLAAKDAGLPLILGSEFTLSSGMELVLLATDRANYGDLSQLITRGRRQAAKGTYRLTRDDVAEVVAKCIALWLPALDLRAADIGGSLRDDATFIRDVFAERAWIGVELLAQAGDAARLAQSAALSKASGLPLVAAGDAHMHVRARRALQDTLTAIRLKTPLDECGHALHPNGERHLRSRARLASLYPPALLAETLRIAERCHFSLDELRYEYPEEIVPPGETATSWLRKLVERGLARRYGENQSRTDSSGDHDRTCVESDRSNHDGPDPDFIQGDRAFRCTTVPASVRALIEHELALIVELGYEPYFLTVQDIVAYARSQNILCQGRGFVGIQ